MCMYIKSTEPAQRTLLMPGVELKRCDCAKCRRHGWEEEDRIGGGAVGRRERRENAFSLWTVVYERRDERQALISNRSRGKHFVADLELEVEMAVGTMDECGEEREKNSQWRTSVTTRIKKFKDRTGPGRDGVSEQASFRCRSSHQSIIIIIIIPAEAQEITIALRRAVKKSCQSAGDSLGQSTDPNRTNEANTMELLEWREEAWCGVVVVVVEKR